MLLRTIALLAGSLALTPAGPAQNPLGNTRQEGNPLARKADPFVGTWKGDGLTMVLRRADEEYAGHFELEGARYPVRAQRAGEGLKGSFEAGGERYAFTGERTSTGLRLDSGGNQYSVVRMQSAKASTPKNPLAGARPAADASAPGPAGAAPQGTVLPKKTKDFRHPLGFRFQHPEKWQVQSSDEGILVVPDDAARTESGEPLELFIISAEDAEGVQRPDQPEVVAFFDQSAAQMFPDMKRTAEPEALESLIGPGTMLRYSGKTPTGLDGHADLYLTLYRNLGVFMLHLGTAEAVDARRDDARRMFSSFGWQRGSLDKDLVGLWHHEDFSFNPSIGISGSMDGIGSSFHYYYEFREDGNVAYSSEGRFFGSVGGGDNDDLPQVSIDDPGSKSDAVLGMWSVAEGTLTILWNGGGVERASYLVFPHTEGRIALKLTPPGEEKGTYFIRQ